MKIIRMLFLALRVQCDGLLIVLLVSEWSCAGGGGGYPGSATRIHTQSPLTANGLIELSIESLSAHDAPAQTAGDAEFSAPNPGSPREWPLSSHRACQVFRGYLRCLRTGLFNACAPLSAPECCTRAMDRRIAGRARPSKQLMYRVRPPWGGFFWFPAFPLSFRNCRGVDVTDLVKIFDLMRLELRRLVPATAAVGALNPPEFHKY